MSPGTQLAILFALLRLTPTYRDATFEEHNGKNLSELWEVARDLRTKLTEQENMDVQTAFNSIVDFRLIPKSEASRMVQ